MAAIGMMIGGAVVNALAFSGSNYLFSRLGDSHAEQKRHDEAVEQLQSAQAAWTKKRAERLDYLNAEMHRQQHALQTDQDVEQAMQEYSMLTGKKLDPLAPEPTLSDFYVPSEAQKDREIGFIVLAMTVTGFVVYKLTN